MNLKNKKVGFIGAGNMTKAMIKGFIDADLLGPEQIYVSTRTPKKLDKLVERFGVQPITGNDELVNNVDIVILGMKPQDYRAALDSCRNVFSEDQLVISLIAGVDISDLKKVVGDCGVCRVMMNTPVFIRQGVIAYCCENVLHEDTVERLFSGMGKVIQVDEGEAFEAFTVASSSGTGFIFEIMSYWQEWIVEHGIDVEDAREIVVQTFLGTAALADSSHESIVRLQERVVSKKGVTAAGLESIRRLEVEGLLRMSFNKSVVRGREIGK